ncbi:uncharacterized protein PHACADRAFT_201965 [Phanerochaete carnosa HHB-10118-sp]|uniref:Uncharacterized protein n=1 Tax=Phanerochaete carnosa (strain HHB-10118-sp) TaxID=650164 RepID=K5UI05_PHACS|nr:uncharacterized protein PHACADRAFT_201965 [Phanerochaete carnosa HHB-10118-sp]EKM49156.1 hypothetical protein PHACADRAFT_201965 [Phanerochaete carnosa HHB-10118-sp]
MTPPSFHSDSDSGDIECDDVHDLMLEDAEVDDAEDLLFIPIEPPSANASANPEYKKYVAQLQLRSYEQEHEIKRLRLELAKMKSTIPKGCSKVTKAAQNAPKGLIKLQSTIHKYAAIAFFCYHPWVDQEAFDIKSPLSPFDRKNPVHWNMDKGEFKDHRTKVLVHASELFEVVGRRSPLFLYMGQWHVTCCTQRNYFTNHIKESLIKYTPDHERIFKLSPMERKTDSEAIMLRGSKKEHFPPCYYPDGD